MATTEVMDTYCERVAPIHDLTLSNQHESRTLAALRDTLLPKLISGEVRVPDVEKVLEDAL